MEIAGLIISQLAAYGLLAFLLIRIIIPELKAVRESPFLSYAIKQAKRKKYLVTYVSLSLISAVFMFIGYGALDMQNPGQGNWPMLILLIGLGSILSIIALVYLLLWIFYFFRQGKSGLFQDLYVSGSRIQDATRPFMWILFVIVAVLNLISNFSMTFKMWVSGVYPFATLPLTLAGSIAYSFVFLSFFFYVAIRGIGVLRIILCLFGVGFVFAIMVWVLMMIFALMSGFVDLPADDTVEYQVFSTAASTIAATLIGWLFYWRFLKAEPGPWIEKMG